MKATKVSVCVVTYNHENYIRTCLESIIKQETDFEFEIIVGDDCSTDGTSLIIREFELQYPGRVKYLDHKKNIGASKNYITVHNEAIGEYIAHIDGDDYWATNKLNEQVKFMENSKECIAVYSNAIVVAKENKSIGIFNSSINHIFDTNYLISRGNFLCHSTLMYRSAIKDKILNISGNFIDYQIHIKLSENGFLGYINKNLTIYRSDSSSSIFIDNNNYIRKLYLNALLNINKTKVNSSSLHAAFANFLAEAMHNELMCGTLKGYKTWQHIIKMEAPVNIRSLKLSAYFIFIKNSLKKVMRKIALYANRKKVGIKIFHPR